MEALYAKFTNDNTRATSSSIIEEYQEEEVWAMLDKPKEGSSNALIFGASSAWGVRAPRPIMRATSIGSNHHNHHHHNHQSFTITRSAPVSTPDWYKFLNITPKKNLQSDDDECDDDGDNDILPPHEFLARRYARTRVVSSMYEGVGRTLKGRDLINFRNAVLSKTGFIE